MSGAWARRRWVFFPALGVWATAIALGLSVLGQYSTSAGPTVEPPVLWPDDSSLTRDGERPTLLLFAHPHCPCTRATVNELARVLARTTRPPQCRVLFIRPSQAAEGWEQTGLWDDAAGIPGVDVRLDLAGQEARRFGVQTSGHALLYDSHGRLRFSGGLTALRGHEGSSTGAEALLARMPDETLEPASATVFGCSLFEPGSSP